MQVDTFLFGTIDVSEQSVINFPAGLPAFENCKRFTLVHEAEGGKPVTTYTLQSLDDPHVAFQIADPIAYGFHYELELSDEESATLKVGSSDQIAVMLVLFRRDDKAAPIEANLRAPILINAQSRIGIQKIIERVEPNLTLSNLSRPVK
jgi:flagellar assembly factor FliW